MLEKNNLSEKYVGLLHDIFEEKNWFDFDENVEVIFEKFCHRLSILDNDEQRDLIIELTRNYLWIPSWMYEAHLKNVIQSLIEQEKDYFEANASGTVIICPMVPNNFEAVKSGTYIAYLCQSVLIQALPSLDNKQVQIRMITDINSINAEKRGMIILIDDFIGSGNTAFECMAKLNASGITPETCEIVALCLVAQEEGIRNIKDNCGINTYYAISRPKGITDVYPQKEAEAKLSVMKSISEKVKIKEENIYGFDASESLVTMIRTPNNTFPFYWFEKRNSDKAPFCRKTLFWAQDPSQPSL